MVTGGAGFIGTRLCEMLLERNCEVRVLDDLSAGSTAPAGVEFERGDIREAGMVRQAVDECDVVFHLAAMVSVPRSMEDPTKCRSINTIGTWTVAQACQGKRLVFASSTAVYGDAKPPIKETAPKAPMSPYAETKLEGEELVHEVGGISLRFFNVYGPGQRINSPYAAVIPIFASRIMVWKPVMIHGDGRQTRDFVYVDDVCEALIRAAQYGKPGSAYNVGTGKPVTITELALKMGELMNISPELQLVPERVGDIKHSYADTTMAAADLGWSAQFDLADGLGRTIEWLAS